MSSFLAGALGAVTVLAGLGGLRAFVWRRRFRHRRGPRLFLARVFRRLGTRPDQEEVLRAEAGRLATELHALRRDAGAIRAEVAALLAGPALDPAAISAALDVPVQKVAAVKAALADALARIHAALDPEQRARLAEFVREGPRHGPWRRAHAGDGA
jgi:uncharacterized membrane protein